MLALRQEPGWAKGDGEGEILCLRVERRESDARKQRRRRRRIRRAAQEIRTGARARSRAGQLVVGTYNVRTLDFKGTNGIGHAEVILKTCEDAGCDIIGLQEVRRNGQSAFTVAGFMEMLAHSHYESMFSSTALVYRRPHMCRFECNVRMCAEKLLP